MNYFKSFDGERIEYFIHQNSSDTKKAIIFIHGFGGDINLIQSFIESLCQKTNHQVISYSLRGHANSSNKFSDNFDYIEQIHSHDLQALLQHLKVKKPILIGHSLGGIILQSYINQQLKPQASNSIFICTTTKMFGINYFRKKFFKFITYLPENDTDFKKQSQDFYDQFKDSWDFDMIRFKYDTTVVGGFINWLLYFLSLSGWENSKLDMIDKTNNYYIYGKRDIIVPKILQKQRIKHLKKIHKIEIDSGHLPVITNAEELTKVIGEIIK